MHSWQTSGEWIYTNLEDLKPGDTIVYERWDDETITQYFYTIVSNTPSKRYFCVCYANAGNLLPADDVGYSSFLGIDGSNRWWKKIVEMKYDPEQQADEEDDI